MASKADNARERLATKVAAMEKSEAAAAKDRTAWEQEVYRSYNDGLTYNEMAEISHKSRVRVDQVLRSERIRRGDPVGSAS